MDSASANSDPLIGATFGGKYRIIEKLGSGGMGGVYKAEHQLMNRLVAVKVLRSNLLHDEILLKRFHHEAKSASQISHPNAVTLFDYGVDNGVPYLVMEYIEGRTLKLLISEERPVPVVRTAGVLRQICAALHEAHKNGLVHRDIKPDNFMVRRGEHNEDIVKVLDFGVSKSVGIADLGGDSNLTQAGTIIGTPQYISPEQCQGKDLDTRCDIYSLGAVIYEMLSGEPPLVAPTVLELLVKVLHHQPVPIRKLKPELNLPDAVDKVVLKALEKDRDKRYSTVLEFYRDFEKAAGLDAKPIEQKRSNKLAIALGALLVLMTAAYFVRPSSPGRISKSEEKRLIELTESVKKAEAEKAEALKRVERLKLQAELLLQQNETEKAKAIQEQAVAAEQTERQKDQTVKQLSSEKESMLQQLSKMKQSAAAREEELRKEQEAAKRLELENQSALKKAEQEKQEALKKAEQEKVEAAKRIEEEKAIALKQAEKEMQEALKRQQEELAAKAERDQAEALKRQQQAAVQAEKEKQEALKQVEAARAEAARLGEMAKKMEVEKAEALKKIEEAKKAALAQPPVNPKNPTDVKTKPPVDSTATKQAKENTTRLTEEIRKANQQKDEILRRAEQMKVEAAKQSAAAQRAEEEARRMKAEAEKRMQQAQPTPPPVESEDPGTGKKRRRCGPTWCL